MARILLDAELRRWEVFASAGRFGSAVPARLVFRPIGDADRTARVVEIEGGTSEAEAQVAGADDADLLALLARSDPLG